MKYYDYADSLAPDEYVQYNYPRWSIAQGLSSTMLWWLNFGVSNYKTNFRPMMLHTLDGSESGFTEATFREFIAKCKELGYTFTTYTDLYDMFN